MKFLRSRLSYANVVSTIALVLVLGGATAIAANQLPKNSVGSAQLKPNAVTPAKIKPGAVASDEIAKGAIGAAELGGKSVSTDKLADGAVTGAKIAAGSVTADKLASAVLPISGIVQRVKGTASVPFPGLKGPSVAYPLDNPTFTQSAGEDDQYIGAFQVTFAASCQGRRSATATLFIDAGKESPGLGNDMVAQGSIESETVGEETRVVQFRPFEPFGHGTTSAAPTSSTPHTFSVKLVNSTCTTGSGVTATGAQIDVIGTR